MKEERKVTLKVTLTDDGERIKIESTMNPVELLDLLCTVSHMIIRKLQPAEKPTIQTPTMNEALGVNKSKLN